MMHLNLSDGPCTYGRCPPGGQTARSQRTNHRPLRDCDTVRCACRPDNGGFCPRTWMRWYVLSRRRHAGARSAPVSRARSRRKLAISHASRTCSPSSPCSPRGCTGNGSNASGGQRQAIDSRPVYWGAANHSGPLFSGTWASCRTRAMKASPWACREATPLRQQKRPNPPIPSGGWGLASRSIA